MFWRSGLRHWRRIRSLTDRLDIVSKSLKQAIKAFGSLEKEGLNVGITDTCRACAPTKRLLNQFRSAESL